MHTFTTKRGNPQKLSYALYESGEALALCGADIGEVVTEACRGFRHAGSLAAWRYGR